MIERAALLGGGGSLAIAAALEGSTQIEDGPPAPMLLPLMDPAAPERTPSHRLRSLDQVVIEHIERVLAATGGRIEGGSGAAQVLGVNPHTLRARMRKLRIDWTRFRPQPPLRSLDA